MKAENPDGAVLEAMTATEIAAAVRAGSLDALTPTEAALHRIVCSHNTFSAFRRVRELEALVEAAALRTHPSRAPLPLAGVPIAVTDVTAVAGEHPVGFGASVSTALQS